MKIPLIILAMLLPLAMHDCGACYGVPILSSGPFHNKLYLDSTTVGWTATDAQVVETWDLLRGYFARWGIDVTTVRPIGEDPEQPNRRPDVAWAILGGPLQGNVAGNSGIGNFHIGITDSQFATAFACYVYSDGLGNAPDLVAKAVAHEVGHDIGLLHQSDWVNGMRVNEYSQGDSVFVPFMGDVLNQNAKIPQWITDGIDSNGNPQNDITFMDRELGTVPEPEALLLFLCLALRRQRR